MADSPCLHLRAWPSLDHRDGWYCPDCHKGCTGPLAGQGQTTPPKTSATNEKPMVAETFHRVDEYRSHGVYYLRYLVIEEGRLKSWHHIPGGQSHTSLVQDRGATVERLIGRGAPPAVIRLQIRKWVASDRDARSAKAGGGGGDRAGAAAGDPPGGSGCDRGDRALAAPGSGGVRPGVAGGGSPGGGGGDRAIAPLTDRDRPKGWEFVVNRGWVYRGWKPAAGESLPQGDRPDHAGDQDHRKPGGKVGVRDRETNQE